MPKPKPDQIIRHEIALNRPLQESVDSVTAVLPIAALSVSASALATGIGVGAAGIASYYTLKHIYEWVIDWGVTPDWAIDAPMWSDEQREAYRKANPTLWDQIFDGPQILFEWWRRERGSN